MSLPLPALSMHFSVEISKHQEVAFTSCSGLSAKYEIVQWKEGGDNGTVLQLPGRLTYTPVRLTRPVDKQSKILAQWFSEQHNPNHRSDVTITLLDDGNSPIAAWTLKDAWLLSYHAPTMSTGKDGEIVAMESIELTHHGFAP